ncbi:hypothetical protein, partial [Paenibacillus sp. 32O-W]|uniref:hypothetical protein n=1 Tax=Paenibacillus sp. 32O-W TaxID=1695218 RepID=UPI001C92FC8C
GVFPSRVHTCYLTRPRLGRSKSASFSVCLRSLETKPAKVHLFSGRSNDLEGFRKISCIIAGFSFHYQKFASKLMYYRRNLAISPLLGASIHPSEKNQGWLIDPDSLD